MGALKAGDIVRLVPEARQNVQFPLSECTVFKGAGNLDNARFVVLAVVEGLVRVRLLDRQGNPTGPVQGGLHMGRFTKDTAACFEVGDRLRLQSSLAFPFPPTSLAEYPPETEYVVVNVRNSSVLSRGVIDVRPVDKVTGAYIGRVQGGFYPERFELVSKENQAQKEEPQVPAMSNSALSLEQARKAKEALVDVGVPAASVRIRSRSWDTDGRYFAVDVTDDSGSVTNLYSEARVAEYISALKPIDTVPFLQKKRMGNVDMYQFRVLGPMSNYEYLRAPDGSLWFSDADIRKVGGLVRANGKTYRLGRMQFVPFIP